MTGRSHVYDAVGPDRSPVREGPHRARMIEERRPVAHDGQPRIAELGFDESVQRKLLWENAASFLDL